MLNVTSFARYSLVLAVSALALGGCERSYTYQYRTVVELRDRESVTRASNVVRVQEEAAYGRVRAPKLCGEAIAIQLRDGRYLFVLIEGGPRKPTGRPQWRGSPTPILLSRLGLPLNWSGENYDDTGISQLSDLEAEVRLDAEEMPLLVTFKDNNDPTTIRRLDTQNLELKTNVSLPRITLQLTGDEPTEGSIQKILPWLNRKNQFLDGSRYGERVQYIQTSQFMRCEI